MKIPDASEQKKEGALYGLFIGDALAMPVHWYYNTETLRRDYGILKTYVKPQNPHPDSILWRSSFPVQPGLLDILHDQRRYWGQRSIHYHQFLQAGENTLNIKLARELLLLLSEKGHYDPQAWLERMVRFLSNPKSHQDTYVEEYLRYFFTMYALNKRLTECGRPDEKHIGGFSLMLPLTIAFSDRDDYAAKVSLEHLNLTHGGASMSRWGGFIVAVLLELLSGSSLELSIETALYDSEVNIDIDMLKKLVDYPDITVVTKHFSSACYVDFAVPATIYLALKYENNPEQGLIANTMCGGDNAGRGALLGALLGAANGMKAWPAAWVNGLLHPPPDIMATGGNGD